MNDAKRDELLARLDERLSNIQKEQAEFKQAIQKILEHQEKLSDAINDKSQKLAGHDSDITLLKWLNGIGAASIMSLIGYIIKVTFN